MMESFRDGWMSQPIVRPTVCRVCCAAYKGPMPSRLPWSATKPPRQLRRHLLPAIQLAPVGNERAVPHRVHHALLFSGGVEVGGHPLQHDDVVLLHDVDHLALDVGQALLDQGRRDDFAPNGCELELDKLVRVRPRTGANADHGVQHVHRGDGNHTLFVFAQRGE